MERKNILWWGSGVIIIIMIFAGVFATISGQMQKNAENQEYGNLSEEEIYALLAENDAMLNDEKSDEESRIFQNDENKQAHSKNAWADISKWNNEDLTEYFSEYQKMKGMGEAENILLVTSESEPEEYGATYVVKAPNNLYMLQYTDAAARDAAHAKLSDDGVIVENNHTYEIMAEEYLSWGVEKMGIDRLMEAAGELAESKNVKVAVIDTGMDKNAFDAAFPERKLSWYCVVACENDVTDDNNGHGTHVGGTIAEATGRNVELLSVKVTDGTLMDTADVVTAINYAVAQGADVINMSLGGEQADANMETALAAAAEMGIINIASAGNSNTDRLNYPASFEKVMSISAVDKNDERWVLSATIASNYGEKIDFAAAGKAIKGINNISMSGTSMAAPHVAAMAANLKTFDLNIDYDDAYAILKTHTRDIGEEGWDIYYGWGVPDFTEAEFCDGNKCDSYGIFKTEYNIEDKTKGAAKYTIQNEILSVTSEKACVVASEIGGGYVRILPEKVNNTEDSYEFDLSAANGGSYVLVLAGDVNTDGKVNILDLARIKKSILSPNSKNYAELDTLGKVTADINKDNKVNILDLARVKKSILSPNSKNYAELSW